MGLLILLMGPTGAGKSVQGDLLAQKLNGVHLSSGELLRQDPDSAAKMLGGDLLPAHEVEEVVGRAISKIPGDKPVILDGLPRTMSNVSWLEKSMPGLGRELAGAVLIELDLETINGRLSQRNRGDDTSEAIEAKWRAYETETKPVLEHYKESGQLRAVDGRGTVEEVHSLIMEALA